MSEASRDVTDTHGLTWQDMRQLAAAAHRESRMAREAWAKAQEMVRIAETSAKHYDDLKDTWRKLAYLTFGKVVSLDDLRSAGEGGE